MKKKVPEKILQTVTYLHKILIDKLESDENFTGKIIVTINCKNGNIGSTDAHTQKEI